MPTPSSWHKRAARDLETERERYGGRFVVRPDATTHAFTSEGICIFDRKPLDEHDGEVVARFTA